jgi:hypothetical protein
MPPTYRKLELKAKTSVAQTASQAAVCAKGLRNSTLSPNNFKQLTRSVELQNYDASLCSKSSLDPP